MKRISLLIVLLPLGIIIFFTLFGKNIYDYITPKVMVMEISASVTMNSTEYLEIPESAITNDGYVYLVIENQGFSRIIYTVKKQKVNYIEMPNMNFDKLYVSSGINKGDLIISQINKEILLDDGDKVIIE